eukprot:FR740753.1.p1 GENE.FR740753.1~~FR740753.1.p1  ORF type:complete len:168 (+),score=23.55 FR740753.1:63-506(+)
MARCGLGTWLGELSERWTQKAGTTASGSATFSLIAAHDTTLIPVLQNLGCHDSGKWPDYASSVTFELYVSPPTYSSGEQPAEPVVRVLFNEEPYTARIPGCEGEEYCALSKIQSLIACMVPEDKERECMTLAGQVNAETKVKGSDSF